MVNTVDWANIFVTGPEGGGLRTYRLPDNRRDQINFRSRGAINPSKTVGRNAAAEFHVQTCVITRTEIRRNTVKNCFNLKTSR